MLRRQMVVRLLALRIALTGCSQTFHQTFDMITVTNMAWINEKAA